MYAGTQRKMATNVPNCNPRINEMIKKKKKKKNMGQRF